MVTVLSANTHDNFHSESFTPLFCHFFPLVLQPLPLPALLFYNSSALKNEEAIAAVGHESLENNVIFKVQGIFFPPLTSTHGVPPHTTC